MVMIGITDKCEVPGDATLCVIIPAQRVAVGIQYPVKRVAVWI